MNIETYFLQKVKFMEKLSNNQERQSFLANTINRNLIAEKLKAVQQDAELKAMRLEAELLSELINIMNMNDTDALTRLNRTMRLRKLA